MKLLQIGLVLSLGFLSNSLFATPTPKSTYTILTFSPSWCGTPCMANNAFLKTLAQSPNFNVIYANTDLNSKNGRQAQALAISLGLRATPTSYIYKNNSSLKDNTTTAEAYAYMENPNHAPAYSFVGPWNSNRVSAVLKNLTKSSQLKTTNTSKIVGKTVRLPNHAKEASKENKLIELGRAEKAQAPVEKLTLSGRATRIADK